MIRKSLASCSFALVLIACLTGVAAPAAADPGDAERGRQVFLAGGGCSCHTNYPDEGPNAPLLAGGRAMETPFGTYYSTNLTPDPETGIGEFTDADFLRAMQLGLSPDGENYFPVFPYTSFTGMNDRDLIDLRAYLATLPAVKRKNRVPDVFPPFNWRWAVSIWKWMNFSPGRWTPDPERSKDWNRGAYLVEAPSHCGECHTPRNWTEGLDRSMWLAGSNDGPEGELAPNITPDPETGIGRWSLPDITWFLQTGFEPDGDDTQGLMSELIEHGYGQLSQEDHQAIATYLKSLPAIHHVLKAHDHDH